MSVNFQTLKVKHSMAFNGASTGCHNTIPMSDHETQLGFGDGQNPKKPYRSTGENQEQVCTTLLTWLFKPSCKCRVVRLYDSTSINFRDKRNNTSPTFLQVKLNPPNHLSYSAIQSTFFTTLMIPLSNFRLFAFAYTQYRKVFSVELSSLDLGVCMHIVPDHAVAFKTVD